MRINYSGSVIFHYDAAVVLAQVSARTCLVSVRLRDQVQRALSLPYDDAIMLEIPDHPEHQTRCEVVFHGRVQGVGFRWTTQRLVERSYQSAIVGFVRNEPDGTVRLVCEGRRSVIQQFLDDLRAAMGSHIHSERLDWSESTGEYVRFGINR